MLVTKQLLDEALTHTFDMERFLGIDPMGLVYELREHTDNQLDIELGALFTAMITWGNRKAIRTAVRHMLCDEMHWHPGEFILSGAYQESYRTAKNNCVYRTLNVTAFKQVCRTVERALKGSEQEAQRVQEVQRGQVVQEVQRVTLEEMFRERTIEEIISTLSQWLAPARLGTFGTSACKRICMFLRWMIRRGTPDFGLWQTHNQNELYAVMDVHVCQLTEGLTGIHQASWKSCCRLTEIFRSWDSVDPLKYDIALMTVADNVVEC